MRDFSCVYVSGLTVDDPGVLTTLTLFYDKVALPHPYDLDPEAKQLIRWPYDKLDDLEAEQRRYRSWIESNRELLQAGVLQILPPPLELQRDEPEDLAERLRSEIGSRQPYFTSSQVFSGQLAIAMHALFSETTDPELIMTRPGDTSTDHLRAVLATSLLEYRLPRLGELQPSQILELREEVVPYKLGFINYLSQMVDDVEHRLQATQADDRGAALRTVERKIAPELEEFLAQQLPRKVQWWAKLIRKSADTAKSVLKLIVTPWNVANYPDVVSGPAKITEHLAAATVERAGNKHRAFQFLGTVEKRSRDYLDDT